MNFHFLFAYQFNCHIQMSYLIAAAVLLREQCSKVCFDMVIHLLMFQRNCAVWLNMTSV